MGPKDPHLVICALVWPPPLVNGLCQVTCCPFWGSVTKRLCLLFCLPSLALLSCSPSSGGSQLPWERPKRRRSDGKELTSPANSHQAPESCQQPHQWTWEHIVPQSSFEMTAAQANTLRQPCERVWTKGMQLGCVWIPDPQKRRWSIIEILSDIAGIKTHDCKAGSLNHFAHSLSVSRQNTISLSAYLAIHKTYNLYWRSNTGKWLEESLAIYLFL